MFGGVAHLLVPGLCGWFPTMRGVHFQHQAHWMGQPQHHCLLSVALSVPLCQVSVPPSLDHHLFKALAQAVDPQAMAPCGAR